MLSAMSAQGTLRCCSRVCMDSSRRCTRCCAAHPVETAALLPAPALKLFASCKLRCRQPAPGALLWSCAEHQEVPEHSPGAQHVAPWSMAMGPCIATNAPPRLIIAGFLVFFHYMYSTRLITAVKELLQGKAGQKLASKMISNCDLKKCHIRQLHYH